MTNKEIYSNLESKVNILLLPVLDYFEKNSNESYEILKLEWAKRETEIKSKTFEILLECITDVGIDTTIDDVEDRETKYFILQVCPYIYERLVVKFYNEKIYDIIFKRFSEEYLTSPIHQNPRFQ